jgi:cellulose synthase/poly-beta-1,6-N-acetylglucosamine synthase-like glycosyltransferase
LTELIWGAIGAFNYVVLAYFVVLNAVYLATSFFAFGALRRYALRMKSLDLTELIGSSSAPSISLLAPAYNEERTCVEAVRSLLTLEYPAYEVILVNDGSTDGTLARLIGAFELEPASRIPTAEVATAPVREVYHSRSHPALWLIDKENGGKADALNSGLNYCYTPIFCAMDADSLLEPEALIRIVRPFLEDATTIAAGGILRIANGCLVDRGPPGLSVRPHGMGRAEGDVDHIRCLRRVPPVGRRGRRGVRDRYRRGGHGAGGAAAPPLPGPRAPVQDRLRA